jgi:hypothetical protein
MMSGEVLMLKWETSRFQEADTWLLRCSAGCNRLQEGCSVLAGFEQCKET